jgi:uncharacterized protein (DUF697 family)
MRLGADRVVRATEIGAAAVAAILSPIPLADELILAPALLGVAAVVGHDRGRPLASLPWRVLTKTAICGLIARAAFNLASASVPGVAAVANAVTAFALTRAYAEWVDAACSDPRRARVPNYQDILRAMGTQATSGSRRKASSGAA